MTPRSSPRGSNRGGRASHFSTAELLLLADAGRRLSGPIDLGGVLHRASRFIVPELADWYVLALMQADGHMRAVAFDHSDPERRGLLARLTATTLFERPAASVMARAGSGTLGWVPRLEVGRWCPSGQVCAWHDADLARLGTGSVICAPLTNSGESFGAVLLARAAQDSYSPRTIEVVAEITHRIAVMIANAGRHEAVAEELQQVNEALAVAAHELRTPTAALRATAELMLRQYGRGRDIDADQVQEALVRIDRHAVRLSGMIERLLDAACLGNAKLSIVRRETDVRELVSSVVDLARASAPNRVVVVDAPHAVQAEVDALRIEQVLSNLVDNAFKFSPDDTPVELSVRVRRPGTVTVAVRDHGVGVPVDRREEIFDRFVQAHRDQSPAGLGLGLYLSQRIVEQHGGRLTADYPQDGGARFVVELPALETITSEHRLVSSDPQGGSVHDAARAQTDWSTRGHSGRSTGHVRQARLRRPAGVPGAVQAGISA